MQFLKILFSLDLDPGDQNVADPTDSSALKFLSIKCVLLVVLFLYCIYYYTVIDTVNPSSPFYVAERIFYLSMVVSSIMFVSLVIGLIVLVYLKHKKPRNNTIITFKGHVRHTIDAICMYSKVIMQGKLFQRCTHF